MTTIEHKRPTGDRHPLSELTPVYGQGPAKGDIDIALVGDAPSPEDVQQGKPFQGPVGKFLTFALSEALIYRPSIWVTNVVSRTISNFEHVNAEVAYETERYDLREEIRYLKKKRNLKAVGILGEKAGEAFGINDVAKSRGSVYIFNTDSWKTVSKSGPDTIFIVATYHPKQISKNRWTRSGKGKADYFAVWTDDLKKLAKISKEGWQPPKENFIIKPDIRDVETFVRKAIEKKSLVAIDIETTGFDPSKDGVVCIGLAVDKVNALVVPYIDGPGTYYWNPNTVKTVNQELNRLFSTCDLMFQNALFDVPFLRAKGFSIPPGAVKHDTMLLHHAISPELPHNLGFIVSQYGETPYWKDEFQNRNTSIVRMDQTTLRTYNARDCVVLHQVLPELLDDLKGRIYYEESLPLIEPILEMVSTGVLYNHKYQKVLERKISQEITDIEDQLRTLGNLPEPFNLGSEDDLRLFLLGIDSKKYDKGEEYDSKRKGTKVRQQMEELYKIRHETVPIYKVTSFRGRKTDSGKTTLNKQGRLSLQRYLQNRLFAIANLKKRHPSHDEEEQSIRKMLLWLEKYQLYSELIKIKSTYLSYPVNEQDNRVHTKFLIHGTATGRLSSREPNLQNLPKRRAKEIRALFVAPEDSLILAADYSNLEVRVMAYETGDPELIDIVDSGKNLHDINTRTLFHLTPEDPMWGPARRAAKIFQFGSLAYGGGDNEIYEKVILDVPELVLTFQEFVDAKERYMEAHPVYVEWRQSIIARVKQTRQIENAFGRTRTFYGNARDIEKEALNFPIQSAAASIINRATIGIWNRLHKGGYRSRLQAQIHDELRLEVKKDELQEVAKIVEEEMASPLKFYDKERVFPIEMEIGPTWADLKEYKQGDTV